MWLDCRSNKMQLRNFFRELILFVFSLNSLKSLRSKPRPCRLLMFERVTCYKDDCLSLQCCQFQTARTILIVSNCLFIQ